jgi:hypothetical protein
MQNIENYINNLKNNNQLHRLHSPQYTKETESPLMNMIHLIWLTIYIDQISPDLTHWL